MNRIYRVNVIIFILIISLVITVGVSASTVRFDRTLVLEDSRPVSAPTLIPTVYSSSPVDYPTPESRILPDVGSNALLVIGASVLVLIIIGGVLSARLRPKH